jgi:hypothetical protein
MVLPTGFCLGTFGVSYANLRDAARLIDELRFDHAGRVLCGIIMSTWIDPREVGYRIFNGAGRDCGSRTRHRYALVRSFRTDPSHPCPSMCGFGK